jgi:pimeloyl-ACP methyl ester carboxylesterase
MQPLRALSRIFAGLCVCSLFIGCAANPNANAQRLAQSANLQREQVRTDAFLLTSFVRIGSPLESIHFYIEGDGYAWRSRNEPALDPTPRHALALQLAARDPGANVVYLARPCQFTESDPHCETAYWTGKRYAPEVIAALDQAISHYAARAPGLPLDLIGYSGGGALAVLIAARRHDIGSIRTVAGNLDPDAVMRLHDVSPLTLSVNPMSEAAGVAAIPQIHFSGGKDTVVPPSIAEDFVRAVGGACVRLRVIPHMGHEGPWADIWRELLLEPVVCRPRDPPPTG